MNDKITESEFQEIIRRRSNGKINFPQFLEELSQRGINEYEIEVATGQATYKGVYSGVYNRFPSKLGSFKSF